MKRFLAFAWSSLLVVCLSQKLLAQNAAVSTHTALIPLDQIGIVAGKQYSGDGLSVLSNRAGLLLHCEFQRLDARATAEGLWLTSTVDGAKGEAFRIIARTMGREDLKTLSLSGRLEASKQVVRFIRPGLTEEYSVSVDGVRQDFVLEQGPKEGTGPVRLELEVDGAKAEAMTEGACLVLEDGGRKIIYHQLKAQDARGKALMVQLEVLSANRLVIVLDDTAAKYPVRIDPTFSDANWISLGGLAGVDAAGALPVYAAIVDDAGNLYIGGSFTAVGNAVARSVAKWNGNTWSALGSGTSRPYGFAAVYALAISGTNLYAGGDFTTAGGISATNVAQWNGSSWSALGSGINGTVRALAISGPNLYAGGNFTAAGDISATNIAQWDGNSWLALNSGLDSTHDTVYALAVSGTDLYVGGDFTEAGGIAARYIARWNGNTWSALSSGMNGTIDALLVLGTNLYAGGNFTTAGGLSANGVAQWNGNSWSAFSSGISSSFPTVYSLVASGTNLYAGGQFVVGTGLGAGLDIARWNGSSWSALGSGVGGDSLGGPNTVYAVAVSGTNVYACGVFANAGGIAATNIAHWNGNWWSVPSPGVNGFVNALAVLGTSLYVGGQFNAAGGIVASNIAIWNGTSWSAFGSGMNSPVQALAVSGTNLYAGGNFTTAGGIAANYVAKWNGTSWSALGSGMNGTVRALVVSGANLYAGGDFTTAGGIAAKYVAKWNGNSWSALGSGLNGTVRALAVSDSSLLYVGGSFTTAGGVSANHIACWNGNTWSALSSGMNGTVDALAISGTNLYTGGNFTSAGGVTAKDVAQWNGSSWSALGLGINSITYALVVSGTNLYAGGQNIAKWDGNSWSTLGSGVTGGNISTLAISGNNLYVGGSFIMAGNKLSPYLAEAILGSASIITTDSNFGFINGDNQFGFDITGDAGQVLVIQASTNLMDWTPLQTNLLGDSPLYFSDPCSSNSTWRFYRAQLVP